MEVRIPTGEGRQCVGATSAGMPAHALKKNHVLPELVAQLRDFEVAHDDTVHKTSIRLQSEFLSEIAGYGRGRGVQVSAISVAWRGSASLSMT
jgi:hypothetical protein